MEKTNRLQALVLAVLAAGVIAGGVYGVNVYQQGATHRSVASMEKVESGASPASQELMTQIKTVLSDAGVTSTRFWMPTAGSSKEGSVIVAAKLLESDDTASKTYTIEKMSYELDEKTNSFTPVQTKATVDKTAYIQYEVSQCIQQYAEANDIRSMDCKVLTSGTGIIGIAAPSSDDILSTFAQVMEDNQDATLDEQFDLMVKAIK